jgi:hypothetical protein
MRTNTIYFSSGEPSVEVLRLSKDGIWANPDIPVDDAAKFVLNAIGYNIKVLVQAAVSEEREACAKIGDDHPSWSSRMYSATIRARGQA